MATATFNKLVLGCGFIGLVCLAFSGVRAEPRDNWVQHCRVQLLSGDELKPGHAGVYLENGLVITAAHVAGDYTRGIRIDGMNVPAKLIKTGFPQIDLALISV